MKELFGWLTGIAMLLFTIRYSYQIWRRQIFPALSTWIIFLLATGLSLGTYAIAEKHDFQSGILNVLDVMSVSVVLTATLIWGKHEVRFMPFEKWYLMGIAVITAYGIISGNAWNSNVFTQILITTGYIPTAQKLIKDRMNSESFTGWGLALIACSLSLYPAFVEGNLLAKLYSVRSIVSVLCIIGIMTYYEFKNK